MAIDDGGAGQIMTARRRRLWVRNAAVGRGVLSAPPRIARQRTCPTLHRADLCTNSAHQSAPSVWGDWSVERRTRASAWLHRHRASRRAMDAVSESRPTRSLHKPLRVRATIACMARVLVVDDEPA